MYMNKWLLLLLAALSCTTSAVANVNLELRSVQPVVTLEDVWQVGLYAVSDNQSNQMVRALQVILAWDPECLQLDATVPCVNNGPYPWLLSGFYSDSGVDGLNNTWTDGDAYYQAAGNFTTPAYATPAGLLVATFRFHPLKHTLETELYIPSAAGQHTHTGVIGAEPGLNVVGLLGTASVQIYDWGLLALELEPADCCLTPGQVLTVRLTVADLHDPINGVQAIIRFDEDLLTLQSITLGDGLGSPWDIAAEVYENVTNGYLTFAAGFPGSSTSADAVVATITYTVFTGGAVGPASIALVAEEPPLLTKLTRSADATAITPLLGAQIETAPIVMKGDINGDGMRDGRDIQGFVTALLAEEPTATELCAADMNCDCALTIDDVPFFVNCVLLGQCMCP
jgi:hypothetical protein